MRLNTSNCNATNERNWQTRTSTPNGGHSKKRSCTSNRSSTKSPRANINSNILTKAIRQFGNSFQKSQKTEVIAWLLSSKPFECWLLKINKFYFLLKTLVICLSNFCVGRGSRGLVIRSIALCATCLGFDFPQRKIILFLSEC